MPPQPAPSIANGTFAPMLCGKKRYFQPVIFYLLIPASLCHLKLRKPSFDQLPGAQTTKEFHPRIVFYQPCHTLLIEVIKMIVTDQQIIDIGKYIGIGRKITLPLNERNITENGSNMIRFLANCRKKELCPSQISELPTTPSSNADNSTWDSTSHSFSLSAADWAKDATSTHSPFRDENDAGD